jgi:hypothetical protein
MLKVHSTKLVLNDAHVCTYEATPRASLFKAHNMTQCLNKYRNSPFSPDHTALPFPADEAASWHPNPCTALVLKLHS